VPDVVLMGEGEGRESLRTFGSLYLQDLLHLVYLVVWGCEAYFADLVYGVASVHLVHLVDLVVEELAYDCELVDDDEHEEEGEAERLRVDRHGLDDLVRVRDTTWG